MPRTITSRKDNNQERVSKNNGEDITTNAEIKTCVRLGGLSGRPSAVGRSVDRWCCPQQTRIVVIIIIYQLHN